LNILTDIDIPDSPDAGSYKIQSVIGVTQAQYNALPAADQMLPVGWVITDRNDNPDSCYYEANTKTMVFNVGCATYDAETKTLTVT
jgi:hypothetical protein